MSEGRRKLNGFDSFTLTHENLQSVAGNAMWVNEHEPIEYEHTQFFDPLL